MKVGPIRNVLKDDLGLSPFKYQHCQLISESRNFMWPEKGQIILEQLKLEPHFSQIWIDEMFFAVEHMHNGQNGRLWGVNIRGIPVNQMTMFHRQHPSPTMFWEAWQVMAKKSSDFDSYGHKSQY